MEKIVIDKYLCVRCGQCVLTCPSRLYVQESPNNYPSTVPDAANNCISCNHCVAACPVGAIKVDGVDVKMCEPISKETIPRFDHIATLVRMRRSVRRFAPKPVDEKVIEQLMNVLRWAPSAKNGLPVKWIVVSGREKVRQVAELVINWMRGVKGLEALPVVWDQGIDPILRDAPVLVIAYTDQTAIWPVVDTSIAVETLDLCAAAMRLGSCWAGFFIRAAQSDPAIKKWLGLTEKQTVQGGLMIGHIGDEVYNRIPYRPDLDTRWIR